MKLAMIEINNTKIDLTGDEVLEVLERHFYPEAQAAYAARLALSACTDGEQRIPVKAAHDLAIERVDSLLDAYNGLV